MGISNEPPGCDIACRSAFGWPTSEHVLTRHWRNDVCCGVIKADESTLKRSTGVVDNGMIEMNPANKLGSKHV